MIEDDQETITEGGITWFKSLEVMKGESKVWEFVEVFKPASGTTLGTKVGRTTISQKNSLVEAQDRSVPSLVEAQDRSVPPRLLHVGPKQQHHPALS